ncbi:MAG: GAF domain-containing protein [Chloroflexi bacterium]|nr:GAF domain-containing protein [Chloroflexota bacterium]
MQRTSNRTLYRRALRLVIPFIVVASLIGGIIAVLLVRYNARAALVEQQQLQLGAALDGVRDGLVQLENDVVDLAARRSVRTFARDTLVTGSATLQDSQTSMVSEFAELLEEHPNVYLSVRYVTFNGTIWTEAVLDTNGIVDIDRELQLSEMAGDTLLLDAGELDPGNAIMSGVLFRNAPSLSFSERQRPILRVAAPVATESVVFDFAGVVEIDVDGSALLREMRAQLDAMATNEPGRRVVVVSSDGVLLYDTDNADIDYLREAFNGAAPTAAQVLPESLANFTAERSGETVGSQIVSSVILPLGAPEAGRSWVAITLDEEVAVLGDSLLLAVALFVLIQVASLGLIALIANALRRTLQPMTEVRELANQIVRGASPSPAAIAAGSAATPTASDAITTAATAGRTDMSQDVEEMIGALQAVSNRVEELQRELEAQRGRFTRNIDLSARVSRETATLTDIDDLLNRAIRQICEEFGFYHAQVFLLDDAHQNAVLVYSYGERGRQLLERGHKLPVGSQSVIGLVTSTGHPVVVNNTDAPEPGIPHRPNPLLPETRAEMAVALQYLDNIIGALDIQSTSPNVFHPEEVRVFQMIADQIAVAIQNVRLLIESAQRYQQIDSLNRQLTRTAWDEALSLAGDEPAFSYDLLRITPGAGSPLPPGGISEPILIRGEVVGTLDAAPAEGASFTEADRALLRTVAERVAIAVENARLFEETQTSLSETFTLYQLSRYLNEATSLDDIIQAIITSVMRDAIAGQIAIFEDLPEGMLPTWMEIGADWKAGSDEGREVILTGLELRVADHPIIASMKPSEITLIADAARDNRLDDVLRALLTSLGGESMVLIPFSVRGVWRGILIVEFPTVRSFSEREGRIYSALIDQAGVAIDARLLLQQNEIALAEIERLYTASRIINMATNMPELVRAAVTTSADKALNFELGAFIGSLDSTGWPTRLQLVARSTQGDIVVDDEIVDMPIAADSPLRRREPVLLQDFEDAHGPLIDYARKRGARHVVVMPLFSVNQPIALFFILGGESRYLGEDEIDVYRALTSQMSTVLQNRRLLEQTERALDETRRLYSASRAISSATDLTSAYAAAAAGIVDGTPAIARLAMFSAPGVTSAAAYLECVHVQPEASAALSDLYVGLRLARETWPLADIANETSGTVYVPDVRADGHDWDALRLLSDRSGARSMLLLPMVSRGRFYGLVLIESRQPNAFPEPLINFVQAVTDQIAIAVESLVAFQEAQVQAQRALALAEAGQLAAAVGGAFEESIGEVFARVALPAQYDRWLLALVNEEGTHLEKVNQRLPGVTQSTNERPEVYDLSTDRSPIAMAYLEKRTLLVNEPGAFPTLTDLPEAVLNLYGKHLVTPVRRGSEVIGTVMVGRPRNATDLDENDEQLVKTLAAQISVAVENRRLFTAAESERERLSAILSTLPAGVTVLDPITYRTLQLNDQAVAILGSALQPGVRITGDSFHLLRSGTNAQYPEENLPFQVVARSGQPASGDDISLLRDDGSEVDMLITAAPLFSPEGDLTAIITAFQDITGLRRLERTLEANLRETVALYETSRALTEAESIDDVLDQVLVQLQLQEPTEAYVVLLDPDDAGIEVVRSLEGEAQWDLPDELLDPEKVLMIRDVSTEFELDEAVRLALINRGIHSVAVLPMRTRRQVPLGWMILLYDRPEDFGPEREQFLLTLNDSAAVALDNRYLFRSTTTALQETAQLYDATAMISRARSLDQISQALQRSVAALNPDLYAGYIMVENELTELFNTAMDSEPVDFKALLASHELSGMPTIFLDDLRALQQPTALESELLHVGNIRSIAVVPLQAQDVNGGVLFIGYHFPHRFQTGEGRYLSAIADSASVVLDNYLLLDRIQTTLEETSKLYQASRALGDASEPDEILNIVSDYLVGQDTTQAFVVELISSAWEVPNALARITATWYADGEEAIDLTGISLTEDQYPAWRLLKTQELATIDDTEADPDLAEIERMGLTSLGLRSLAILPLRAGGHAIGCIVLGSTQTHRYGERELRVYRSFMEQASLRLEATRVLKQAERRSRQLVTSAEVSQIAGSLLDLDVLLPRIVDLIRDRFTYDHVQIFLMDDHDEWALLRASTGAPGRQLLGINHKLKKGSQSVIGQVTATARPSIAADTADARVIHRPNPYLPNTRSEMAIPLVLKGRVVGALDVQSNVPNAFDNDDVLVLTTLAGQVATAIDNAQLYDQARRRANEMSFLFSVTTAAASADTLSQAVQNVAAELANSLDAASVAVYLPEQYIDIDDNEFTMLRPIALAGGEQPLSELSEVRLDTSQNLIAITANSRRPLIMGDISAEPYYLPVDESARSAIVVPLGAGAQLVGVITMESERLNAFNDDTLTLLLTLAGTLSAIVQNQQLLERVQTQNDALRELDRLKSDFLANMSHELRTPLNSIIGFSRVILKGIDGPLSEMQEQDLTTIYHSGMHLLNLINDILDQAKIAAGKMDLQSDYFEVRAVVDGVRSIGIGLVKDKPIDIVVDLAPELPKAFGDEFRTRQVLLNLVSNASKFTREGAIKISAYPVRDNESGRKMVRIDVTDSGIGIAEQDIPLLFEAFRQVDSSLTRTAGGTGLGLPIAKSLVEMQGGQMLVNSVVNVGSTFSVVMPTEPPPETEESTKRKTDQLLEKPKQVTAQNVTGILKMPSHLAPELVDTNTDLQRIMTRKRQILLIEDNPDMVDQFRRALAREGFEIFAATIPLEAEAMASGLRPTIVIMDVNFANGAGWDILRHFKARDDTRDIPIVIVSLSNELDKALEQGAFKIVRRPFLPDDIIQAVKEAETESRVDRILIIDDQEDHSRLIEQILAQNGHYRVFSARSGMEGIGLVARRHPNLIILDLRMPDMDGFQVVQELRNNPETATIPILIVTGETLSNEERQQLMNLAVLFKSNITVDEYHELLDGVKSYLDRN